MTSQLTDAKAPDADSVAEGFGRENRRRAMGGRLPLLAVAVIAFTSLWDIRATLLPVPYLDDASVHEQMVRYATALIRSGHDPLTGWFAYLGEGSPQFLHYQSLAAMVTGLAGTVVGADVAFRWSLFLLIGLWPFVIYLRRGC